MKTFIVLQNVATFRIDWQCLYKPEEYQVVLVCSSANYQRLLASGQAQYFARVIPTDDFSLSNLVAQATRVLDELGVADRREVRIVTHDEYSLDVAARLREALGIDGARPAELRNFVDKLAMKRALARHGIPVPRHLRWQPEVYRRDPGGYVARIERRLSLPVFAKPVNESGSVGTARLDTHAELADWCEAHVDERQCFELDEWVEGKLYHCDSITRDGRLLATYVCEYAHPCYAYLGGRICASITLPHESAEFAELAAFTRRVHGAIQPMPRDTVTHLEVFRRASGELVFLEIAARAPAALVPFVYDKHLGLNIEEAHFRLHMGMLHDLKVSYGPYAAWAYLPAKPGLVTRLNQPDLRSSAVVTWNIKVGDHLEAPDNIRDAACKVLLWNDNYADLRRDFEYLDSFEAYSVTTDIPSESVA